MSVAQKKPTPAWQLPHLTQTENPMGEVRVRVRLTNAIEYPMPSGWPGIDLRR